MIGLNKLAEALTHWTVGGEVTSADEKLLSGAAPHERGAQYLTYGRYAPGESKAVGKENRLTPSGIQLFVHL